MDVGQNNDTFAVGKPNASKEYLKTCPDKPYEQKTRVVGDITKSGITDPIVIEMLVIMSGGPRVNDWHTQFYHIVDLFPEQNKLVNSNVDDRAKDAKP
eukprot:6427811-Ditylum_brightwellii.AAC.1